MPEEKPPVENETAAAPAAAKVPMPPWAALIFVIVALLGVLIVMGLRGNLRRAGSDKSELMELEAEISAARSQLNRERVAMGRPPLEGDSESIDEIASRLKKDAETMASLSASFQKMFADKEAELTAKNAELLHTEQQRQAFAAEAASLKAELKTISGSGVYADRFQSELETVKSQRDSLAAELAAARQGVSPDDYADLKRRLEETQRAKDFFETRVKELEGGKTGE